MKILIKAIIQLIKIITTVTKKTSTNIFFYLNNLSKMSAIMQKSEQNINSSNKKISFAFLRFIYISI